MQTVVQETYKYIMDLLGVSNAPQDLLNLISFIKSLDHTLPWSQQSCEYRGFKLKFAYTHIGFNVVVTKKNKSIFQQESYSTLMQLEKASCAYIDLLLD